MPQGMRWVGLDVHAHASAVAVFDDVTGEVITRRVNGRPMEVLAVLRELRGPVRAVYEAGPTGYGLVRRARAEGIEMAVCSPGNIERRAGDRTQDRQARRDPAGAAVRRRRPETGLDPIARAGAAARPGPLPRGPALGSDARPAPSGDVLVASRALLPRAGAGAGRSSTVTGSHSSTSTTRRHGSPTPTICTPMTSCSRGATVWAASSSSSPPAACGARRSRGCAACAGSTP